MSEEASTVAWDEAFNATDGVLIAVEGLIHAARMISSEHPQLNTPDKESFALDSVLRALEEKSALIRDARSAEYRAGLALKRAG